MVVIAQLAEHRIVVPSVVGSSPTIHPKKKTTEWLSFFVALVGYYNYFSSSFVSAILVSTCALISFHAFSAYGVILVYTTDCSFNSGLMN